MKKFTESINNEIIFLKSVEFKEDVNPLKSGFKVTFDRQVCVLVGENGVGKSTILESLADYFSFKDDTHMKRMDLKSSIIVDKEGDFPVKYIDFHAHDKKYAGAFGNDMNLQLYQMKASSGQSTIALLNSLGLGKSKFTGLIMLDEPCRGLSLKNQMAVANVIIALHKVSNNQIIVTTHSQIILKALENIAQFYSVEEQKNVNLTDFISSQLG